MSDIMIILARAMNGAIGKDNDLPWHLPADLKRFKKLTMGSTLIMGRKTFDSLPGVLPGRRHIVMTRDKGWNRDGVEIAHSMDEAIALAGDNRISVIGGAAIFEMFEPVADRIELTEVLAEVDGDVFMPDLRGSESWHEVAHEDHPPSGDLPGYRYVTLERAD